MIVAITGGLDRTPTLAELERLDHVLGCEIEAYRRPQPAGLTVLGATVVRHGDARGTDKSVAAYLRARRGLDIEPWPADWDGHGNSAGSIRNRAMLDGRHPDGERGRAQALIRFAGGRGTSDCCAAALERGIPVVEIEPVAEPRPWNRHHGEPKMHGSTAKDVPLAPTLYCGRGTPVGNPFKLPSGFVRGGRAAAAVGVLGQYRRWLAARITPGSADFDPAVVGYIRSLTQEHFAVCSCWPRHCHVEIVIAAWRWLRNEASAAAVDRP